MEPESVAILGCSSNLKRLSGKPLGFLLKANYQGKIYPVNPKYSEIEGIRCYPSILDINEPIDVALILLPAVAVEKAMSECVEAKVKAVVLISSGFAELGPEGKAAQLRISKMAKDAGIILIGPNCLGAVNFIDRIPLSFTALCDFEDVKPGGLAFVSQSGAIASWLVGEAAQQQVGFSYWITTGNESGISTTELVKDIITQPNVTGVYMYLEQLRSLSEMLELGSLSKKYNKPIICLKVGRSEAGSRAAMSHTGAIAGADQEYDAIFKKTGIIRANDLQEMMDCGVILSQIGRRPEGNRVAIVTLSGGGGIMAADECDQCGLEVPLLSEELQAKLAEVVPSFGSTKNPVDVTAEMVSNPELMPKCVGALTESREVDAIIMFIGLQKPTSVKLATDIAALINKNKEQGGKPIVVAWMAATSEAVRILREANVPLLNDVNRTIRALAKIVPEKDFLGMDIPDTFAKINLDKEELNKELEKWIPEDQSSSELITLNEYAGKELLKKAGLSVPGSEVAKTKREAVEIANKIGYPVVAKICSEEILHKSDVGGVKVNIKDDEELMDAFDMILENCAANAPNAKIDGVLIEEMVGDSLQTIVGLKYSKEFGPMIMFGLGDVFVEVLKDVKLRMAPVTEKEALSMIGSLKGAKMFTGFRGSKPRDIRAAAKAISQISVIGAQLGDRIKELDINPLFILPEKKGVRVGDSLFVINNRKD